METAEAEADVVEALGALAHPVRLQVYRALVVAGNRGLTPGVMQEGLGIPATTLSFHLKELALAGLVTVERSSRNSIYRAAFERLERVLRYLTENCCNGAPCGLRVDPGACGPRPNGSPR
jgi:DNA-binding transcriptional ArsR family regulator